MLLFMLQDTQLILSMSSIFSDLFLPRSTHPYIECQRQMSDVVIACLHHVVFSELHKLPLSHGLQTSSLSFAVLYVYISDWCYSQIGDMTKIKHERLGVSKRFPPTTTHKKVLTCPFLTISTALPPPINAN